MKKFKTYRILPPTPPTIVLLTILIGIVCSCESKQDVQSDIDKLRTERISLLSEVETLSSSISSKQKAISTLNEKLKELNIYESGKTPQYILKIHLKQSHFSLSIKKHIKDALNAIDFEIPVDKNFYNTVSVGTKIVNNFRAGSFILYGSIGDWDMTIKGKEIR